jgi:DDE superfamily endonuclease
MRRLKNLIERAYREGEKLLGLSVWGTDQAGPFQTIPYPGGSWQPQGKPARQPHQHIRNGTAKLMTLFHPATGEVRVKGVRSCTNAVLHPWLEEHLRAILGTLPPPQLLGPEENRAMWRSWQEGLTVKVTLPEDPPPLRMLLVLDNLTGHKNPELLLWMFSRGIMVLYTPLGASWLNMTESMQRILTRRALEGHYPDNPEEIIEWLEATARGWNRDPTPFEWGGRRAARRDRARKRRHALGGSGACSRRPLRRRRRSTVMEKWQRANQMTH